MAITFPRAFPLDGCFTGECSFEPVYQQARSLTGGAQPTAVEVGPTYWRGRWQTSPLSREDFGVWQAWLQSLRGGLKTFKGRPALWKWPQAYPRGFAGISFDGTGRLVSVSTSRDEIVVDELPNGLVLKAGDYLSLPVGGRQHLHRIVEDTVTALGAATIAVEPTIRPNATTGVAVLFDAPYCDMVLADAPEISRSGTRGGSISFSGVQVLI